MKSKNLKANNSDLGGRFYNFALEIIKLVNQLPKNTAGFSLGKQLFRSGTSIAANYEEAKGAFSKKDFTYKISIAFKEAKETLLWLRLVKDSKTITSDISDLLNEAEQIANILGASVKTSKTNE